MDKILAFVGVMLLALLLGAASSWLISFLFNVAAERQGWQTIDWLSVWALIITGSVVVRTIRFHWKS